MIRDDLTKQDIKRFEGAIGLWNQYKSDFQYWLENHGEKYQKEWEELHGENSTKSPGYMIYMIDSFCYWIIMNVM
jgi:hypothetical protein